LLGRQIALVIWEIRVSLFVKAGLHHDPPIYTSIIAEMTGVHHHTQLFSIEIGPGTAVLPISVSQVAKIIGKNLRPS
jgi:hypothetical protein